MDAGAYGQLLEQQTDASALDVEPNDFDLLHGAVTVTTSRFPRPNWRDVTLNPGVLREAADERRLVVWLPVEPDRQGQVWLRVATASQGEGTRCVGMWTVGATAVRARERSGNWLSKLVGRLRGGFSGNAWQLPNGGEAWKEGKRHSDLLLVWACGEGPAPDDAWLKTKWPQAQRVQAIGPRLYLLWGVAGAGTDRPQESASAEVPLGRQAEERLAAARQQGDRAQVAAALADVGLWELDQGQLAEAQRHLEEALTLARALGDRAREGDVLGILGLVVFRAGRPDAARGHLEHAVLLARAVGDRLAEKLSLEHLAAVQAILGELPAAVASLSEALELARTLGDRPHEADLLWHLAILRAEAGQSEEALGRGQAAVELLGVLGRPQARVYAEHLQRYRQGPSTPGYLRMAISAAGALAKFVGSGLKTVSPATLRDRRQRCAVCVHSTALRCRVCGCFIELKARLPEEDCPLGRWGE